MLDERGYDGPERRDDELTRLRMRVDQVEKDAIRSERDLQSRIDELRDHLWPSEGPTIREQLILVRSRTDRIPWLFGILSVLATLGIGLVAVLKN